MFVVNGKKWIWQSTGADFEGLRAAKAADDKYFQCKNAWNKGQIYENGMSFLRKV